MVSLDIDYGEYKVIHGKCGRCDKKISRVKKVGLPKLCAECKFHDILKSSSKGEFKDEVFFFKDGKLF